MRGCSRPAAESTISQSVRIYRRSQDVEIGSDGVVACGTFDGLHLGHRRLLEELAGVEAGRRTVLFDDLPGDGPRLSSRRRCFAEFAAAGAERVVMVRGEVGLRAALHALAPAQILMGAGEPVSQAMMGYPGLRVVEPVVSNDGRPITSAGLRSEVASGDVVAAASLIGRPYAVDGRVVHGFHRGATIGVPTANLRVRDLQLPPDGVYAVTATTARYAGVGVANLGTNPTFGNDERSLETNIFDFDGDLYGARLEVGFVERLRAERKFDGVEALVGTDPARH